VVFYASHQDDPLLIQVAVSLSLKSVDIVAAATAAADSKLDADDANHYSQVKSKRLQNNSEWCDEFFHY